MRAGSRLSARATIALAGLLAALVLLPTFKASNAAADPPSCFAGARSLSTFGSRLYPEMGNGGYTSLHTDLRLNYDAIANLFLPGTRADLQVRSTQCLSELSFDFEQTNGHTADGTGPNMIVNSVEINGTPASFRFVQPTYPGDPNGQDDPDPAAHAVSNSNPVSATNPNPPACSPQVNNATQNGTPCPANKLVVTPSVPIPDGTTVTVTIDYTGRPGVHTDGDGSTEGWFRISTAGSEGSFVTTEPVGNDSWMPMNNYPTAKPTYDIYDTTNIGKVAIGPGELVGYTAPVGTTYQPVPAPASNAPDANFPAGSVTWHWHSPERIANYLVENSIGAYDLTARTSPSLGRPVLGGAGQHDHGGQEGHQQDGDGQPGRHRQLPADVQRAVAADDRRDRRRHPVGELRGGDAGQDHLRGRLDRPVADDVQPREHAPVVRRQRLRGRLQPHLLEGRLGDDRRVPVHGAHRGDRCGRARHAGR